MTGIFTPLQLAMLQIRSSLTNTLPPPPPESRSTFAAHPSLLTTLFKIAVTFSFPVPLILFFFHRTYCSLTYCTVCLVSLFSLTASECKIQEGRDFFPIMSFMYSHSQKSAWHLAVTHKSVLNINCWWYKCWWRLESLWVRLVGAEVPPTPLPSFGVVFLTGRPTWLEVALFLLLPLSPSVPTVSSLPEPEGEPV